MSSVILHADMGTKVIAHLSQFGNLPGEGIVAGQAVSSAIQDLYCGGLGQVYNDVDVFRKLRYDLDFKRSNTLNRTVDTVTAHLPAMGTDQYGGLDQYLASIRSYRVQSVSSRGLLNYVNCSLPNSCTDGLGPRNGEASDGQLTGQRVIESFDLNCTRVAVDLRSGKLVWDRHFERFLNTRQLEIVAIHTPWHTLLRLLKKAEELPKVYADIKTSAEICASVAQSRHFVHFQRVGVLSAMFGEKAFRLAAATREGWQDAFNLSSKTVKARDGSSGSLHYMEPRGEVEQKFADIAHKLSGAALHYAAEQMYGSRRKLSAKTVSKIHECEYWAQKHDCKAIAQFVRLRQDVYVQGQTSEQHVEEVARMLRKHPGMTRLISAMTLDEQLRASRFVREEARKSGEWVYGVLETTRTMTANVSESAFRKAIAEHIRRETLPFDLEPLALGRIAKKLKKRGIVVEELRSANELKTEGVELSHCVGGYANTVRGNFSRIIRIRTGQTREDWSTMEVRARHGTTLGAKANLICVQHQGYRNRRPAELNIRIAENILATHGQGFWQMLLNSHRASLAKSTAARFTSTALQNCSAYMRRIVTATHDDAKLLEQRMRTDNLPF